MTILIHQVDVGEKSLEFVASMRESRKRLKLNLLDLSQDTGIPIARLELLEKGETPFRAPEIQMIALVLGIALDDLFPLEMTTEDVHTMFGQLQERETGMIAGLPAQEDTGPSMDQSTFERSVVHLHHCAECLRKFPS